MERKIFSVDRGPDNEIVFSVKQPSFDFTLKAREHLKSASKETLLAFRSLIDDSISALEKEGKSAKKDKSKGDTE